MSVKDNKELVRRFYETIEQIKKRKEVGFHPSLRFLPNEYYVF